MPSTAGLDYRLSLPADRREPKPRMFGNKNAHVRINCAEFQDDHQVNRFIGAPPSYVGYKDPAKGEEDKQNPYRQKELDKHHTEHLKMTVILLDEIEKAHKDFYQYHLNIFEDGEAKVGGELVSFRRRPGLSVLTTPKLPRAGARDQLRITPQFGGMFWVPVSGRQML